MEDGRGGNAFNPDIAKSHALPGASERMSPMRSHRGGDPRLRRSQIPAVDKALEILELLSTTRDGLSHSAIAAELGRSVNETYRTVELLEARGWLLRSADTDRFSVSLKLFQLGHRHPPTRLLIDRAIPIMNAVALDTEQSVRLGVLSDTNLLILAQVDSPLPMHFSIRLGAVFPMKETSAGIVLLAHMSPNQRTALLAKATQSEADIDLQEIARRIDAVLDTGVEVRPSSTVPGVTNISAPVRAQGGAVAALTIPFMAQRRQGTDVSRATARLALAARTLAVAIGSLDIAAE